ncbi:MAG: DUF3821 domain-containing protein [Methanoregulaceae archaeon]|nr:DUF3821 domain-containing protein [Methanoregulaceae archaeon]
MEMSYRVLLIVMVFAVALIAPPVSAVVNIISPGDVVFIGEEGLNVTAAVPRGYTQIAWFAPGSRPSFDVPTTVLTIGDKSAYYISPAEFLTNTGPWYLWNRTAGSIAFYVEVPTAAVRIRDQTSGTDVTGMVIPVGNLASFRVETNLVPVTGRRGYNPATDGVITLRVTSPAGSTFTSLAGPGGTSRGLERLNVNASPWYWVPPGQPDGWDTGAFDPNGARRYQSGTYTIGIEYTVNRLQDNLPGVHGISIPASQAVTITSGALRLSGPGDPVTRGNRFVTTITGLPNTGYYLWVKGSGQMSGSPGDQPPLVTAAQSGVDSDLMNGPYPIGSYQFQGGNGRTIRDDVPGAPFQGTYYYAFVTTSSAGTRTVEWTTSKDTRDRSYTIHVERRSGTGAQTDEVTFRVVKGSVTVVAGQPVSAYIGEEVDLSGKNTETDTTYLFITGPNLPGGGGRLTDPRIPVADGNPSTFTSTPVGSDNTWEYTWDTANTGIDAGTYTIFATSSPRSRDFLSATEYSTTTVRLARGYIGATGQSAQSVAQGDVLHITGIATGSPQSGVAIWIFGRNTYLYRTVDVNSDSGFDYELPGGTTSDLASGQYLVFIQHPMYNGQFDVYPDPTGTTVLGEYPVRGSIIFRVAGPGSLQGPDAAEALRHALDSPAIDDTYTKLSFFVANPDITIHPFGQVITGRPFSINGTTNLASGDRLLVQVYSSSFGPTPKSSGGGFSGISGTVVVQKGPGDVNTWAFDTTAAGLPPDEYIVTISGVEVSVSASTTLDIVPVPTPTPTPTPTPSPTANITTTVPTTIPTTTPTPAPGFDAGLAFAGILISLASIVLWKRKR